MKPDQHKKKKNADYKKKHGIAPKNKNADTPGKERGTGEGSNTINTDHETLSANEQCDFEVYISSACLTEKIVRHC